MATPMKRLESEALEAARGRFFGLTSACLETTVAAIGVIHRLYDCLVGEPLTAQQLARRVGLDPSYIAMWCEAAYAVGHLDQLGEGYTLTPEASTFLTRESPDYLGGLLQSAFFFTVTGYDFAEQLRNGSHPGFALLKRYPLLAEAFGEMLERSQKETFLNEILPRVPAYREVGERGGLAVDLGCGNGWFLLTLLSQFPKLKGIGVDFVPANLRACRERAGALGLQGRASFEQADMTEYRFPEPVDLVTMNACFHDIWHVHQPFLGRVFQALKPGGYLVVWDANYPQDRRALRNPATHLLVSLQMWEELCGTAILDGESLASAIQSGGFETSLFFARGGADAIIAGRRPRG